MIGNRRATPRGEALAASEWRLTAWHEAAHAVAAAVFGLPLHDARIWWEPCGPGRLMAVGEVRPTEIGGCWADDDDVDDTNRTLVATLAGPYTEAWLVAVDTRRPLERTLAEVEKRQRDGDFRTAADLLRLTPLTRAGANLRAAEFATQWWDQIGAVAAMLQASETVTAAQVRAAAGLPG